MQIFTYLKISFYTIIATFMGLINGDNTPSISTAEGRTITIQIMFGVQSRACKRSGLCKMNGDLSFKDQIDATAVYSSSNSGLVLSFKASDLKKIQPDKETYFKSKKSYVLEETYELPADIIQALEIQGKKSIQAGTYGLKIEGGNYILNLKVS